MFPDVLMLIASQGAQRLRSHDLSRQQCVGPGTEAWGLDYAFPSLVTAPLTLTSTPSAAYLVL